MRERLIHYCPGSRTSCRVTDAIARPLRGGRVVRVRLHSYSLHDLARVPGGSEPIRAALRAHGLDPAHYNCSLFELERVR